MLCSTPGSPIGVAAGATAGGLVGAPIGAVKGAIVNSMGSVAIEGMDKNKLKGLGDALEPKTSAIVLVFAEVIVNKKDFEEELKEYKNGTDALAKEICASIKENLKKGNDLAYLFAIAEDGIVAMKVVHGADADVIKALVLTPDGTLAEAGAVITDDSVIVGGEVVMDDEVVVYEVGVVEAE